MEAALRMMSWQERVRAYYTPSQGADKEAKCTEAVEAALTAAGNTGFKWSTEYTNKHWGTRFGVVLSGRVKDALIKQGLATYDKDTGRMKWCK